MPTYTWNGGPVRDREVGRPHRLWWVGFNEGITVVRDADGVWSEVTSRTDDSLQNDWAYVLRGGYRAEVPSAYYQELVDAGYGSYIEVS
jgi:hypothetical protein